MRNWVSILVTSLTLLIFSGAGAASTIRLEKGWEISWESKTLPQGWTPWQSVDLPCIPTFKVDGNKIAARIHLPAFDSQDPSILIKLLDQPFVVSIDGTDIYRFAEISSGHRKFLGLPWHIIPLPPNFQGKDLVFNVRRSSDPKSGLCDEVVLGSQAEHIANMITGNFDIIVLATVSLMAAFINLIIALSMRKAKPYIAFSLFASAIGTWVFSNSSNQIKLFLIPDAVFWAWLDLTSLYLIPAFVLLFVYQVFGNPPKKILLWLAIVHFAYAVGATLLVGYGVIDPKSPLFPYNCLVPVTIVVLTVYTILLIARKQADAGLIGAGLILMIGFAIHDLMVGLQILPWTRHTLQFGLTSMLIPFSVIVVRRVHQLLAMQRQAEFQSIKDRQRAEIMQNLAHDIKNPLAVFELIASTKTWEEFLSWRPEMGRAVERIHAIIAGFRKDADTMPLKIDAGFIDLQAIASDATKTLGSERLAIKADSATDGVSLRIDRVAIERTLFNLITNAVEAGASTILISSSVNGEDLTLSVADNGPGVPPEMKDKIFQRGQSFGKVGGQGIGLYNVKSIVSGHGGTVEYIRENDLSVFQIILPGTVTIQIQKGSLGDDEINQSDQPRQQSVLVSIRDIGRKEAVLSALANYPLKIYLDAQGDQNPSLVFTDDHDLMERYLLLEVPIMMENGKDAPEKVAKQIVRRVRGRSEQKQERTDHI